jgi:hypothetical protein
MMLQETNNFWHNYLVKQRPFAKRDGKITQNMQKRKKSIMQFIHNVDWVIFHILQNAFVLQINYARSDFFLHHHLVFVIRYFLMLWAKSINYKLVKN